MTSANATPANLFDENGVIITDVYCRRCGYNLRGLRHDGRCPECGTPVGLSTFGDLLRFADPDWVDKLALGIKYILWGLAITIVTGLVGSCLTSWAGTGSVILQVVLLAAGLVGVYGAWLLTEPDPSGLGEDRYLTARKLIRIALIVGLLNSCLQVLQPASLGASRALAFGLLLLGAVAGIIGLVGEFAKFTYLGVLADRVPAPDLAKRARFLRWAILSVGVLATLAGLAAFVLASVPLPAGVITGPNMVPAPTSAPSVTGPGVNVAVQSTNPNVTVSPTTGAGTFGAAGPAMGGGLMAFGCIAGVAGLVALVFWVMAIFLQYRLGNRFKEQAEIARATWGSALAGQPLPPR